MENTEGIGREGGSDVVNVANGTGSGEDQKFTFKTCRLSYTKEGETVRMNTVCKNEADGKEAIRFIEGMLDSKEIVLTPPKITVE